MAGLELRNVRKGFGDVVAVDNISLDISEGELFFLLGPSGCGKTTLLRMIAGFSRPDHGTIRFAGVNLESLPVEKRNIGMVFQNYSLWPHMSVFDNVAYGMRVRKVGADEIRRRVIDTLKMVDMQGLEERKPGALSGGQQQRIALARALVYEPRLLLLDEPLSNLDAKLRKDMRREIRNLHERLGITMVYVTHDQEEAASMADRIALLCRGRVEQVGTPRQIYRSPRNRYTAQFFGRANILRGRVRATGISPLVTVSTTDGDIVATAAEGETMREGLAVEVMIRPESLSFVESGRRHNVVRGTLVSVEFTGAVQNYTIDIGTCELLVMEPFLPHQLAARMAGDQVEITFEPQAAHVMPAQDQQ